MRFDYEKTLASQGPGLLCVFLSTLASRVVLLDVDLHATVLKNLIDDLWLSLTTSQD